MYSFERVWPGDQVAAGIIAGRAAAEGVKVVRVLVSELDAVIALLFDRRHREHHGPGAQVHTDHGVGRIRVERLNSLVLRRIDARDVAELVPGRVEFGVRAIQEIGVTDTTVRMLVD